MTADDGEDEDAAPPDEGDPGEDVPSDVADDDCGMGSAGEEYRLPLGPRILCWSDVERSDFPPPPLLPKSGASDGLLALTGLVTLREPRLDPLVLCLREERLRERGGVT